MKTLLIALLLLLPTPLLAVVAVDFDSNLSAYTTAMVATAGGEAPYTVRWVAVVEEENLGAVEFWWFCDYENYPLSFKYSGVVHTQHIIGNYYWYTLGTCNYTSGGTKTARLVTRQGRSGPPTDTDESSVAITEPVGTVTTTLTANKIIGEEPLDVVLTACTIGEKDDNISCDFWCDDPYAGAAETVAPGTTVNCVSTTPATACPGLTFAGAQGADGFYQPKATCTRNAISGSDTIAVAVKGQQITAHLTAVPTYGNNPTDVNLIAYVLPTTCPSGELYTYIFDCDNVAADSYGPYQTTATTYNLGVSNDEKCTYASEAVFEPTVTVDCGTAAQSIATTQVTIEDTDPVYNINITQVLPPGGCRADDDDCLDSVSVCWSHGGDATGFLANPFTIDCGDGAPSPDVTLPGLTNMTNGLCTQDTNIVAYTGDACDYTGEAAGPYTITISGTRQGSASTDTHIFTVLPADPPVMGFTDFAGMSSVDFGDPDYGAVVTINTVQPDAHGDVTFNVTNTGGGNLDWALSEPTAVGWLSCTPATSPAGLGNSETDLVTCEVDTTTLPVGITPGEVLFTDLDATHTTRIVRFEANVSQAPYPELDTIDDLNVSTTFGVNAASGSFGVHNIGTGSMRCTIQDSIGCGEDCTYAGPTWVQYSQPELPELGAAFTVLPGATETITTTYTNSKDCQQGGSASVRVKVACSDLPAQYFDINLTVTEP